MAWAHVAVYLLIVLTVGLGMSYGGYYLSPKRPRPAKLEPYECGVPPLASSRERFSVRFYLIAIMFILFDIETVFLIPWAVVYKSLGVPGLVEMFVFLAVIGFGLFYIWKRGALEWD